MSNSIMKRYNNPFRTEPMLLQANALRDRLPDYLRSDVDLRTPGVQPESVIDGDGKPMGDFAEDDMNDEESW